LSISDDKHLFILLKTRLHKSGIKVKWWIENYLPDIKYSTANAQLHGFNPMSDEIKKAIKKYMEE